MNKKLIALFFIGTLILYSAPPEEEKYDPSRYSQDKENENYITYEPIKEYLEMSNKSFMIRDVIKRDRYIQEEIKELHLNHVNNEVQIKNLKNMDSLVMHSEYPLVVMLPLGSKVMNAYCFPNTVKPFHQFNRIDLIPSDELLKTTLVISYIDGEEPKTMTILISKIQNNTGTLLQREVRYVKSDILDIEEVLTKFYTANMEYPTHNSMIRIGQHSYVFIEDKINGTLRIGNTKFIMNVN